MSTGDPRPISSIGKHDHIAGLGRCILPHVSSMGRHAPARAPHAYRSDVRRSLCQPRSTRLDEAFAVINCEGSETRDFGWLRLLFSSAPIRLAIR